jgi:hypothetical protein
MPFGDSYHRNAARLAKVYRGNYRALQREASQAAEVKKDLVSVTELLRARAKQLEALKALAEASDA